MKNTVYRYIHQLIFRPPKSLTALRSLSVWSECSSSLLNLANVGLKFACIASPVSSAKFDKPHDWNIILQIPWFGWWWSNWNHSRSSCYCLPFSLDYLFSIHDWNWNFSDQSWNLCLDKIGLINLVEILKQGSNNHLRNLLSPGSRGKTPCFQPVQVSPTSRANYVWIMLDSRRISRENEGSNLLFYCFIDRI